MKIAYITAGAAGMYCGSCLHDNTLVAALLALGHDAVLVPTYTPIRTDEPDVSHRRIFFGGINVYLQQKLPLFRHTPWLLDRLFDARGLLNIASRFAVKTEAQQLGEMTVSMLKGERGYQRKEVFKLVQWLAKDLRPEIINLTNSLLSGLVAELKRRLDKPIICTLQGDDIFLEALPPRCRDEALQLIRQHCRQVDAFITTSAFYAEFMADYLELPRERIHVVYPGLNLAGHGQSPTADASDSPRETGQLTIGYFARVCPEKGLHVLAEAFRILRQQADCPFCCLKVSGWLSPNHHSYLDDIRKKLNSSGLSDDFEYVESPDRRSKIRFLQGLDVLSVPTIYREPKGLYVLEALANGVPVVQPRHGSFPELIEATDGGLLVEPNDPLALARGLLLLLQSPDLREQLGRKGRAAVYQRFHAERMARETVQVYERYFDKRTRIRD